jgi:NADH dehydrogenase
MSQRILIVGAGFAGLWSALAAMRLIDSAGKTDEIEVVLIAPEPALVVRPRLYETGAAGMSAPLTELFEVTGIRFVQGMVETIRADAHEIALVDPRGAHVTMGYDRLILAAGSRLVRPDIPGLREYAFSIDQLDEAAAFEARLHDLAALPQTLARNTIVVAGGGFTGIEIAAELPDRLRASIGADADVRVIIVEQAEEIGPDLGPGPRPVILEALDALGIEMRLGAAVTAIDPEGVVTSSGERIAASTVIWTGGMRASDLTRQVPGERDELGRLYVDRNLRVPSAPDVFATGDTARAATDDLGNHAIMSCQHALRLGRSAGYNAAADLLGMEPQPYSQPDYGNCLDLGPWGAVITQGWERKVLLAGVEAKERKRLINNVLIYPPKADRATALAAADPVSPRR